MFYFEFSILNNFSLNIEFATYIQSRLNSSLLFHKYFVRTGRTLRVNYEF